MSKKILIVGPAWVGDMVMAQSLFKTLKDNADFNAKNASGHSDGSALQIDVLAPNWSRALLDRMPEVRQAHSMPIGHGSLELKERYRIAQSLKSNQYDQAIVLPNSWKSALIPWWAKIPRRTGFLGEFRYGLLNDIHYLNKQKLPLMIDRFNALASDSNEPPKNNPYPRLIVQPETLAQAVEKFSLKESAEKPILALCPGAEFGASKRWPEQYYGKVASAKIKEGWSVWLFGSQNDRVVAARIQEETQNQCIDLTGKTNLGEAIDLLSLASMVLTNDSGLMHVAAALEKPLVAVYGSTSPGFTPPLYVKAQIVRLSLSCSPCFKRECPLKHHACMQTLYPEQVLKTMDTMVS